MSDQASRGTSSKARGKKASGNSHPVATAVTSKSAKLKAATLKAAARRMAAATTTTTIHVGFPTPSVVPCPSPFQAMGTAASTTQMDATAVIHTPNGQLIGTLDANPPPPFTWSYTFPDPPQGVPLSLVVTGTTSMGTQDQVVVPFQCQ